MQINNCQKLLQWDKKRGGTAYLIIDGTRKCTVVKEKRKRKRWSEQRKAQIFSPETEPFLRQIIEIKVSVLDCVLKNDEIDEMKKIT